MENQRLPGLTARWTELRPHEQQSRLWFSQAKRKNVVAGRGSGKSELAKRNLVLRAGEPKRWHDPRYFYGAPTREQAKRLAWQDLLDLIPSEWIDGGRHGPNVRVSDLTIQLCTGATIHVVGLHEAQRKIEGNQWDGGILDESCDIKPGTYSVSVAPALVHRDGWLWRIGVPKRHGVGAVEFKKAWEQGNKGTVGTESFWWPSEGIVPASALADAARTLDAKDYREQFGASWETAGGFVFHAFNTHVNVRPCEYHADRPLIVGVDFNVDPMAWVIGQRYDDRMEWIDEIWLRDTNTQEAADTLARRYGDHRGGIVFFGDATGGSRKTSASASDYTIIAGHPRLKPLGVTLRIPAANPRIHDRLAACNAMFRNASGDSRMFVSPSCVHLIDDLENRAFKQGTSELDDYGDVGHITDAMGYAVHRMFPIRITTDAKAGVVTRKAAPLCLRRK